MNKQHIKFVLGLLAIGILLACTQTPEQIAEKAKNSTVLVSKYANGEILGIGSGFFVERDQIVTNIHLVVRADKVTAKLVNKDTEYTISGIVAFDAKNDLVVLKTIEKSGEPLTLSDSKMIRVDEHETMPIVVVGNPGGVEGNVAHGTIHGTRSDKMLLLNTGISEGQGYSGGPVLNSKGRVIGIVVDGTPRYTYAIPSTALSKITFKNQKLPDVESLSDWQKRPEITAYYLLSFANKTHREIHTATQLDDIDEETIKDLDIAIENCTIAIESYKELDLSQTFGARVYRSRGSLWYFRDAYDKAIKDFEEVFKLIPDYDDSSLYNNIGLVRWKLGQSTTDEKEAQRLYKEAIEDLDEAIRLNPDYVDAYYNRAFFKSTLGQSTTDEKETQRLYEEAIKDLDEAITLKPDYADGYHTRGNMKLKFADFYKSKGNKDEAQRLYEEAIKDFDEAIRLNPDSVDAYYNRAIAKWKQGQFKFTLGQSKDDKEETPSLYEAAIKDLDKALMDMGEAIKLKRDHADIGQDEAVKRKQHYADAYHSRGNMKLKFADLHKSKGNKDEAQRLYEEAIKDFDEATRLGPSLKTSVQQMQKRAEEAFEQLKK